MQLRRIEIRDFRKIDHRVVDGLQDGLNVVVGDNEAGKSTMLAALRAVFFERHRVGGTVADSMQPYGGTLRPRVSVDFHIDGKAWSLSKAFCQRPEASLVGPGEKIAGDAVEDRLAELFGFTPPGRGGSKPEEHQGTHGLLWVEQGTRSSLGVGAGRNALAAALEREVGQVTGGERGRALLEAAAERRDRFWDRRDKPKGDLLLLRRAIDELVREQEDLSARQRSAEAKIGRLAAVSDILARQAREDRLNRAVTAVGAASRAVAQVELQGLAAKEATARLTEAERTRTEARHHRERRQEGVAKRETARASAEKSEVEADEARAVARHRDAAAREAEARARTAREERDRADDRVRGIEEALLWRQAMAALADQEVTLSAAEAQSLRRRDALARAEARSIDADVVAALAQLEKAADKARAEVEAASVQIVFEPQGDRWITVDGIGQDAGAPLGLARDAVVELEGFGRLLVRPGGGTAALAQKAERAERVLREALQRQRAGSVAAARQLLQERTDALAEAASFTASLSALAPKGIEALRQAFDGERLRLARPLGEAAVAVADTADPLRLDEAKRAREAARLADQQTAQDAKAAAVVHQAASTEAATLSERAAAARRQEQALAQDLAAARLRADDDLLDARLAAAEGALAEALQTDAAARSALAASDPETANLVLERAERAEREIRKDLDTLQAEKRDLQVELRAMGQDGIGERLAEIEGQLGRERQRLEAKGREAAASRLLHDTLLAAQRESKDRWLGPVRARVQPYLKLIHPESDILMDEQTLEIEGLIRAGLPERFDALSMGAREQVAVITRLALADVLRAAGHPAAIILDDALVNTDEGRLERMHNVLTRAAQTLQILIFTCRERDFLGLGATHRI